jgi:hypothetical protein
MARCITVPRIERGGQRANCARIDCWVEAHCLNIGRNLRKRHS